MVIISDLLTCLVVLYRRHSIKEVEEEEEDGEEEDA
jgi:hypothetical protein